MCAFPQARVCIACVVSAYAWRRSSISQYISRDGVGGIALMSKLWRCTLCRGLGWMSGNPSSLVLVAWTLPAIRTDRRACKLRITAWRQWWQQMVLNRISIRQHKKRNWVRLTIGWHGLAEWWAYAQDDSGQDVLIARDQEEGAIFRILNIWFVAIEMRGYKPIRVWVGGEEVSLWDRLTRVVFGRIGSQQLGSRCKQQFGQVVGSRLFVRRGLLLVAFDIVQGMGQSNPLQPVRTFLL